MMFLCNLGRVPRTIAARAFNLYKWKKNVIINFQKSVYMYTFLLLGLKLLFARIIYKTQYL